MKYCTHCGSEMLDDAVICVKCGCSVETVQSQPQYQNTVVPYVMPYVMPYEEDKPEAILVIISIIFPLVGIIMGYVMASDHPVAARAYRKAGWIVVLGELLFYALIMLAYSADII